MWKDLVFRVGEFTTSVGQGVTVVSHLYIDGVTVAQCDVSGISYICAHVPMSPRARTSVPDDWF